MVMRFYICLVFVLAISGQAQAACLNPAGTEGEMIYNAAHKVMQYCDGSKWYGMGWKGAPGNASSENTHTTSAYIREFSGKVISNDGYPACGLPAKIVTLGRLNGASHNGNFIELSVYGSHRGYNQTSYYEYKRWVIMVGDHASANTIEQAGSTTLNLYNGSTTGDYNNLPVGSGFDVRFHVPPTCGAGRQYTYVVRYTSDLNFTPSSTRVW